MNIILPIGSVVKIKNVEQPIMIFGYLQKSSSKEEMVDYVGVLYPVGNINISRQAGFQMTDITEVLFEGYRTEEFKPIEALLEFRRVAHNAKKESV